jgi:hypothetical protein
LSVKSCKAKHFTNMRGPGDGKGIQLEAPLRMTLERVIEYIDIDEYLEATPKSLRLRKRILDATARMRAAAAAWLGSRQRAGAAKVNRLLICQVLTSQTLTCQRRRKFFQKKRPKRFTSPFLFVESRLP